MMTNFVYPFNFVPPPQQKPRPEDNPGLGKYSGFQELHRYTGKTGRIEFTLTNLSPLFIPDSEGTSYYHVTDEHGKPKYDEDDNPQYHRVMDFFNINGRLAIPGTSLKGMIRSVAEALSNSSYGVFTPEEKRFTFRKTKDLDPSNRNMQDLRHRKWGRWEKNGTIESLEAAKIWREDFDTALCLTDDDQRSTRYNYLREHHTVVQAELWQLHTGNPHVRIFNGTYSGTVFSNIPTPMRQGQLRARARFKSEVIFQGQSYNGPMLQILRNALSLKGSGPWNVDFRTIPGVPSTGRTRQREERVCWIRKSNKVWTANQGMQDVILWPRKGWNDMEPSQRNQSYYIAALYPTGRNLPVVDKAKQNYKDANKGTLPEPGDIVRYYEVGGQVIEFGPVAMFKTPERATVSEIAKQTPYVLPRTANNSLCRASRLFGWTPEGDSGQEESKFPVAGRVRVSVAWSNKKLEDTILLPLQILGSPKPQYYPFYLRPLQEAHSRQSAYYATSQQVGDWWHRCGLLRGRKFYLHHPDAIYDIEAQTRSQHSPTDPEAACDSIKITPEMTKEASEKDKNGENILPEDLRSQQNSTAAVLPPGAKFKGYIEFDSLSDYELGLLLWAISLSNSPLDGSAERAHKLGMGRPIGMGSIRLKIDSIITWDPVGGWRDSDSGEQVISRETAEYLIKVFKTWMVTGNETSDDMQVREFDKQAFYVDLCNVLNLDLAGNDPVQYYPPNINAYEGYQYFVNQRQQRNKGEEEPLFTPRAIANGDRQTDL